MEIEIKWTIPEDVMKEAFGKLEIDDKYYPVFSERAICALNGIATDYEPEQDDIEGALDIAKEYMNIYVGQIEAGLSELWATTYANYHLIEDVDDSAWKSYCIVCDKEGREQADNDLALFAYFLSDDPKFINNYIYLFKNGNTINETNEFIQLYDSLIAKVKSEIYARQYSLHHIDTPDEDYCHLYASKYEECINKGIDNSKAQAIAEEYEARYDEHYPQDEAGKEFIKGYIIGYEYAIVNGVEDPKLFATEYQKYYISVLNPDGNDPFVVKGKYDDIIRKILPIKSGN